MLTGKKWAARNLALVVVTLALCKAGGANHVASSEWFEAVSDSDLCRAVSQLSGGDRCGQLHRVQGDRDKDRCPPYQYKDDNGNCVDKPGTEHHHGHHEPESGEECWDECLCREGQYPSGGSCSPCSYEGTVCTPRR